MKLNYKNSPTKTPDHDMFNEAEQAVRASREAYETYSDLTLNARREIFTAICNKIAPHVVTIAEKELEETGFGNVNDKIIKLVLALSKTPGVEYLTTEVITGDSGMTLYEYSPYGVICAIHPSTNPSATLINNVLGMLAAGNVVINIPHPRCIGVSMYVTKLINEAIFETCRIENLVITLSKSAKSIADEIINHPDVSLIVATGGRSMNKRALQSSKRVIAAGKANPVAIVDETADIAKAAKDIVDGATFDHNSMCITEKNIVLVDEILPDFVKEIKKQNVYYVEKEQEIFQLAKATLKQNLTMNRTLQGKSANEILTSANITCNRKINLIVVKVFKEHPFVTEEMLMPLVPLVTEKTFEEALETALFMEQGLRHTAIIHSQSIPRMNKAAKIMQTSIFIKNGSSLAGIGLNGEDKTSFTIANISGEGVTSARDFARKRSCTMTDGFSIR